MSALATGAVLMGMAMTPGAGSGLTPFVAPALGSPELVRKCPSQIAVPGWPAEQPVLVVDAEVWPEEASVADLPQEDILTLDLTCWSPEPGFSRERGVSLWLLETREWSDEVCGETEADVSPETVAGRPVHGSCWEAVEQAHAALQEFWDVRQRRGAPRDWVVGPAPRFTLGVFDGERDETFTNIRDVARLTDGSWVVVDGAEHQLTWVSPRGETLRNVGREGEGPGEFESVQRVRALGEVVEVYDSQQRRVSVFGSDGGLWTTQRLSAAGAAGLDGPGPRDSWITWAIAREPVEAGTTRDRVTFGWVEAELDHLVELGSLPGMVRYRPRDDPKWGSVVLPFHNTPMFATSGSRIFATTGGSAVLDWYDVDSGARGTLTLADPPGRIPLAEAWAAIREDMSDDATYSAALIAELNDRLGEVPLYSDLLAGADGYLWLRRFRPVADNVMFRAFAKDAGGLWQVHDPVDGSVVARLRMPPGFEAHWVSPDEVAGALTDPYGVQTFAVFDVHR